ncbi:hypothetical protein Zm00014a_016311 [Zea mays]|uniref:Uncharacterized protein n=1 Tax=Zea mays TaxID=4577 RepID=A0A317Y8A6_MAIZE|nr:hypothetical protein Zm00014a_016311 [Zea mays]
MNSKSNTSLEHPLEKVKRKGTSLHVTSTLLFCHLRIFFMIVCSHLA